MGRVTQALKLARVRQEKLPSRPRFWRVSVAIAYHEQSAAQLSKEQSRATSQEIGRESNSLVLQPQHDETPLPMKHHLPLAHGSLQSVFDGIWFVRGAVKMPMKIPMKISRSMTVIQIPNTDELVIVNSMRLDDRGLAELDALGRVTHVIRIGGYHGKDDAFYRERYAAKLHAVQGQLYTTSMDMSKAKEPYLQPDEWLTSESALPLPDAQLKVLTSSTPPEGLLLLQREGGILITADSLQNTPSADEFVNLPAKLIMKKMGFYHPHLVGPAWMKFARPQPEEVQALLDLQFEHVLPGHGFPVIGSAKEKYMPSIATM